MLRKRRRENKEMTARQHSDVESSEEYDHTEGIKPDVEDKIDEYRRKRSQNYEDEKFHRKLKAEEKKNFNKAAKQAEKDKKRFDNIMRYGVKIGAKREKVTQENKKAIFDRYHGVWMQLDKTYRRYDSDSDDSEPSDDDRRSSKQRKYDTYDKGKIIPHSSGYPKGQDYYRHPMDRKHAWQSYYAAAYNYYHYMQQQHPDRRYQERSDGYEVEPSGSRINVMNTNHITTMIGGIRTPTNLIENTEIARERNERNTNRSIKRIKRRKAISH